MVEGAKSRPMFGADVRELVPLSLVLFRVMVVSWKEGGFGTYVRPVDRFTPARNADTGEVLALMQE